MNIRERNLLVQHMAWADRTFPRETLLKVAQHLVKEVGELERRPKSGEEHADVYLLAQRVVGLVRRSAHEHGIDMIDVAEAKLLVNESRTWEPGADGVYEHVRGDGAAPDSAPASFNPDWAVHPGETLAELLDEQHLSARLAAKALGWPVEQVNQVAFCKLDITPEMAADLAQLFGIPVGFWLNVQARFTAWRERQSAPAAVAEG